MKNDIIIAGVGGQGIVSIASVLGLAAVANNLYLKQSEVHGMSQRGGDVQSHLRLSDRPIFSDIIAYGQADIIISVEPMEALRHIPWLSAAGWIITNSTPYINIDDYPDQGEIISELNKLERSIILDAENMAREAGSVRSGNMVVLGAASGSIDMPYSSLEEGVAELFGKKGREIIDINLRAMKAGREFADGIRI